MQPPNFNGPPGNTPPPGFGSPGQPQAGAQVNQPGAQGGPQQGGPQQGGPAQGGPQQGPGAQGGPQQGGPQQGWGQPAGGSMPPQAQGGWGQQPAGGSVPPQAQGGWGQQPGGPPQGGFGGPGQGPAQGGWGQQPQQGWGGGPGGPPMAGGFAPAAGGFGSHARFHHQNRPAKTGPSIAIAIVKIGVGGFFLLSLLIGIVAAGYQGYGVSFMLALFLAACVWAIASGVADIIKKKMGWQISLAVAAAAAMIFTAIGPSISRSYHKSQEKKIFTQLSEDQESDYFDAYRWKYEYVAKVDEQFQRPEWQSKFYSARIATADREKNAAELRTIVKEIDKSDDKSDLKEPRKEATKAFRKFYDAAKEKLYAGRNGKNADPALRQAFSQVLDDLSSATDATIYVAFVNKVNLDTPKGDARILRLYRAESDARRAFPKGAPVIKKGNAFSKRYDQRRRSTFIKAMGESFSSVFDSNLVALAPLEKGADRDNKVVLEVNSSIYRIADYYKYNRTDSNNIKRFAGLLFAIEVSWAFKLFDRNGKVVYAPKPERSLPADSLRVSRGQNDPLWAMYSVMMDSAYYNYSRKVTGKFGLMPPPEKKFFTYQGI